MNFYTASHTDVGIKKDKNQDSYCILQAETPKGTVLLAMVCDGMGGLDKGEVASASIITAFKAWFCEKLPYTLSSDTYYDDVKYEWDRIIKTQNQEIAAYGRAHCIQLGSTVTAMIVFEDGKYLIGHVGDSRAYKISNSEISILTKDQTIVANEVRLGKLTPEEAARDPRRNVLLQCVGASRIVEPEYVWAALLSWGPAICSAPMAFGMRSARQRSRMRLHPLPTGMQRRCRPTSSGSSSSTKAAGKQTTSPHCS